MSLNDCEWALENDPDDAHYETSCGNAFVMTEGTPAENGMFYCCYCGKPLIDESKSIFERVKNMPSA